MNWILMMIMMVGKMTVIVSKDPTEWLDTDSNSIGNNADTDDDNDGWIDTKEVECGTGPLDAPVSHKTSMETHFVML